MNLVTLFNEFVFYEVIKYVFIYSSFAKRACWEASYFIASAWCVFEFQNTLTYLWPLAHELLIQATFSNLEVKSDRGDSWSLGVDAIIKGEYRK